MRTFPRAAWLQWAAAAALVLAAPAAHAQSKAEAEVSAAFEAAQKTAVHGPSEVKLAEQATMRLPEGFAYVPPTESGRIMTAMGNRVGEGLLGLVFPGDDPDASWFVVIRYIDAGYIRDDDAKDKSEPGAAPRGVNYNTYALGRHGYVSLNLVTEYAVIEKEKPIAQRLLGALEFNAGTRYADFNSATDRVAEYGLAALVGGFAAKKLGLFA